MQSPAVPILEELSRSGSCVVSCMPGLARVWCHAGRVPHPSHVCYGAEGLFRGDTLSPAVSFLAAPALVPDSVLVFMDPCVIQDPGCGVWPGSWILGMGSGQDPGSRVWPHSSPFQASRFPVFFVRKPCTAMYTPGLLLFIFFSTDDCTTLRYFCPAGLRGTGC